MSGGAPTLRLVTYNVNGLSRDVDAVVRVIRQAAPDAVCVQEAPRRWRWRSRCADFAWRCGMLVASGGGTALGNLLLVSQRVRVHEDWTMRFPLTPGRHMRGAAFARCSAGGRRFVLVGSHLATDPAERPEQAALLRAGCSGLSDPVLLGVDVNETASGLAWRTLCDSRVDAGADNGEPTYDVVSPRRRIDTVFMDGACRLIRCEVLDTPDSRIASDHFPVLTELELPEPENSSG